MRRLMRLLEVNKMFLLSAGRCLLGSLVFFVLLTFHPPSHAIEMTRSVAMIGEASIADSCNQLGALTWQPTLGQSSIPPADALRPIKGKPFRDPILGTCLVRFTHHDIEPPRGFARNDYSRRQAFNADSTRALIVALDGAWHLYDAMSMEHLRKIEALGGDVEPQWHPKEPDLLYFVPRNGVGMKLYELTVSMSRTRLVADFGARIRDIWPGANAVWTRSEGSPSADLRYWAFQVDNASWQGLGMFTYDMQTDSILATYDFVKNGKTRPDHLSMSPTGEYVVVSWNEGPVVFSRNLTNPRPIAKRGEHSDIALNVAGEDVYVSVDYDKRGGPVYMINLKTGARTDLFDSYIGSTATAMHFSGKSYARPGWVVISTYADTDKGGRLQQILGRSGYQWLHRKVFIIELSANPTIVNLAFHHSQYAEYWTEPQASTNRDLTRILFNSNWGTASKTDVDTFMVVLTRDWKRVKK